MSKLETNTIDTISGSNTLTLGDTNLTTVNMASGVSPGTGMGKVLQVVSTTKTDVFSSTAGIDSPVAITNFSASITPTSTSSKILILINLAVGSSSNNHAAATVFRDSTAIAVGDADGSRPRTSIPTGVIASTASWKVESGSFNFLDTPSSTSSLSYSVKIGGNGSSTIYVNRSSRDTNSTTGDGRHASTITLMEIAG